MKVGDLARVKVRGPIGGIFGGGKWKWKKQQKKRLIISLTKPNQSDKSIIQTQTMETK